MSKKLIPKCLTAWTPIYRTNVNPFITDENQETLQSLAQATEGYRNGEIDEKQQQKNKRRQAFTNVMLAGAMAEDPEMMIASGWRQNEDGNFVQDLVDDPGVKALRNNLAVLGATTLAAPAAGYMIADAAAMGLPWWGNFIGEAATGVAGGIATDAIYKGLTGKSWAQGVRDMLPEGPKWIPDETKTMLAEMTNPGGWLSFGMTKQIGDGLNNALNSFTHYGKNLIRRGKKYILGNQRYKDLQSRLVSDYLQPLEYKLAFFNEAYDDLIRMRDLFYLDQAATKNQLTKNELDVWDLLMKAKKGLENREYTFFESPYETRGNYYESWPSFFKESKVDLEKVFDPKYNPNALQMLEDLESKGIVKVGDNLYIPHGSFVYPELNTGLIQIPKFGTDEVYTFNLDTPKTEGLLPISNYSTKNKTALSLHNPQELGAQPLPEDYVKLIQHNIDYVLNKFPGTGAYGSSVGTAKSGLPHAPNDIELYVTDKNFQKFLNEGLQAKPSTNPETFKVSLDDGRYSTMGTVDMNVIKTRPDGTIDFTSERGLNLFRQLYPDEYQKAYLAARGDLSLMYHPMKAQDLIDNVSIENTIMDTFESSKSKHTPRALWYINRGNPDQVYDALIKHGNSLVGEGMLHAPVDESMFTNALHNLELLQKMNLGGLENLEKIAADPKRMKLVFEYWWLNNTILSRGTSIENMPKWKATELGIFHLRDFNKFYKRNMTEWSGGTGGTASGTGLNTVQFGDSGGGVNGNDIYGQLQPFLYGYLLGMTPDQLITLVRNNYPKADLLLPTPLEFKGKVLKTYQDILNLESSITPEELDLLSKLLGIRGILGDRYHGSNYVGITSPVVGEEDLLFVNPAQGRNGSYVHPTNDVQRAEVVRQHNQWKYPSLWFLKILNSNKHYDAYYNNKNRYSSKVLEKLNDVYRKIEDEIRYIRLNEPDEVKRLNERISDINQNKQEVYDQIYSLNRKRFTTLPQLKLDAAKAKSTIAKLLAMLGSVACLGSFIGYHADPLLSFDEWNYYNNEIQNILNQYDVVEGPWKEKFEKEEDVKKKHLMLLRLVKNGNVKLKTPLKAKGGKLIPRKK